MDAFHIGEDERGQGQGRDRDQGGLVDGHEERIPLWAESQSVKIAPNDKSNIQTKKQHSDEKARKEKLNNINGLEMREPRTGNIDGSSTAGRIRTQDRILPNNSVDKSLRSSQVSNK